MLYEMIVVTEIWQQFSLIVMTTKAKALIGQIEVLDCIRSDGKKNLLFLPSNMAAVQNLYCKIGDHLDPLGFGDVLVSVRKSIN